MENQVVLYSARPLKNEDLRAPKMKKIPILLVFMCFAAHADWQLVHTDPTQARFFIDKDNLQVINGYRRAWILNDLGKPNEQGTASFRSVEEYDCEQTQARVMQIHAMSGPMATENIMARRSGNGQWVKPDAGAVDKQLMDSVCSMPLSSNSPQ
jgi:hypothetical protein